MDSRGARLLVDLKSVAAHSDYLNNVGEPENYPYQFFVHKLEPYYWGYSAWGTKGFYEVGPISEIWMNHPISH